MGGGEEIIKTNLRDILTKCNHCGHCLHPNLNKSNIRHFERTRQNLNIDCMLLRIVSNFVR